MFWLASRPDDAISFSQAGGSYRLETAGVWWASMPFAERSQNSTFIDNKEYIENKWDVKWGDRLNELVFIGQEMDKEKITSDLENCLLNEEEVLAYGEGVLFSDPFPKEI